MTQLRGGCSAAFGTAAPDGGEALALVAEVAQPAGLDGEALAAEIRRCVAAEHGASLAYLRLLRPRCVVIEDLSNERRADVGRCRCAAYEYILRPCSLDVSGLARAGSVWGCACGTSTCSYVGYALPGHLKGN